MITWERMKKMICPNKKCRSKSDVFLVRERSDKFYLCDSCGQRFERILDNSKKLVKIQKGSMEYFLSETNDDIQNE